jgi:DNA-binding response OmpR family regulator
MATLWLVEDDPSIGAALLRTFEADGHETQWLKSVGEAEALMDERAAVPDLVVLDLGLPDGDGLDLCRRLRERFTRTRVLMLTARAGEMDVVLGLDAGAIDYVSKPFRLGELLARVRRQLHECELDANGRTSMRVGDLAIDVAARRVFVKGCEIDLRPKEFDLLARLAAEPGVVVRREVLMSDVWDEHWFGATKTLDVHMAALRRRLGEMPGDPSRIATVRGIGYRLEA